MTCVSEIIRQIQLTLRVVYRIGSPENTLSPQWCIGHGNASCRKYQDALCSCGKVKIAHEKEAFGDTLVQYFKIALLGGEM